MPAAGEWTVDGSVEDFRLLQARLRATGQRGLRRNMGKAIRTATAPARKAVKAELATVMPHGGGLNTYLATSKISTSVLTSERSAGVEVRGRGPKDRRRNQGQFSNINRGNLRRPVFADASKPHREWHWVDQSVPSGWWEEALRPFGPEVQAALVVSMNVTAREAGFTH